MSKNERKLFIFYAVNRINENNTHKKRIMLLTKYATENIMTL